jgi:hypothetical protein
MPTISQAATQEDSTSGVIPPAPWRVKTLSVLPGYRLAVTFQDGASGTADLSSVTTSADAGIFAALADPRVFEQAYLDLGVVMWPNGADLDPAWMHERIKDHPIWSVPL